MPRRPARLPLLLAALLAGCTARSGPPDLLLLTVDTLRADHVGAFGGPATPGFDDLAAEGVAFERATAVSNNTLPDHVAMLSGRYPARAGVPRNGHRLPDDTPWGPALLAAAGYETAAFVSASALAGKLGLDRGFAHYDDDFDVREVDQRQRRGETTVAAALAWLRRPHDRPVFAWVHLFDPHYPYTPPAPYDRSAFGYRGPADGSMAFLLGVWGRMGRPRISLSDADARRLVELYDGEIAYAGHALGPLLAEARRRDALVVFMADHGESLTEHGYLFDHGEYLYQPSVHVPLVVRPPAAWKLAPGRSRAPAQSVDVLPTLLSAAGAPVPDGLDGRDLLPLVREAGAGELRPVAFAESCRPWRVEKAHPGEYPNLYKAQAALRWPWKLILTPYRRRVELYDLDADPGELHDVAADHPEVVRELRAALSDWRRGTVPAGAADPDNMEAIRALGYVE